MKSARPFWFIVIFFALFWSLSILFILEGFFNSPGDAFLTGAATATATGNSELTITSSTQISNKITTINFSFGTNGGYVNETCSRCDMDTDIGQQNTSANSDDDGDCCVNWENITEGFLIENTGNENLSMNLSCSGECSAAEFIGGTDPAYQIKFTANSVAQQPNESSVQDTVAACDGDLNATYKNLDLSSTGVLIVCGAPGNNTDPENFTFSPAGDRDAFVIDINLSIPSDAPAGVTNTSIFTFTAESLG